MGIALLGQPLCFDLVTTAAAAVSAAAQQRGKSAVFPHAVNKGDKYRRATSRKDAFETVTAAACRNKQKD